MLILCLSYSACVLPPVSKDLVQALPTLFYHDKKAGRPVLEAFLSNCKQGEAEILFRLLFDEKEADVLSLIDESKRLMHIFDETASSSNNPNASNNGKDYNEIPESDQLEIKSIAQELGEVLQKLKDEGQAI